MNEATAVPKVTESKRMETARRDSDDDDVSATTRTAGGRGGHSDNERAIR